MHPDSFCFFGCCRKYVRSVGRRLARAGGFLLLSAPWGIASPAEPLVIPRGEPQLFVDDKLIAESHAVQRTLRQPRKDGGGVKPVLSIPQLFGRPATLEANVSIVYDPRPRLWVMYCLSLVSSIGGLEGRVTDEDMWKKVGLVRFVSSDGLNWRSDAPDGVERVFPRTREDLYDPIGKAYAPKMDLVSVCFNAANPEWPYQAWIWLSAGKQLGDRKGVHSYRSKDGRIFERGVQVFSYEKRRIKIGDREFRGPSDATRVSFDPVTGRYLGIIKFYAVPPDPLTEGASRARSYLWLDRMDVPVDLSRIKQIQLVPEVDHAANGDLPFDEYYDATAYRYGSHWLGELKIWHLRGNYAWSAAGSAFLKFMSSDDGITWRRAAYLNDSGYPEVFVANGPEGGNDGQNDGGYITCFNNAPLRIGDELIFYYGASSYGKNNLLDKRMKGGGIFRARLRLDGFVSVDFGRLTTPLLRFAGDDLRVNSAGVAPLHEGMGSRRLFAETPEYRRATGVTVEALDEAGVVLGLAKLDGDGVRQLVRFDGKSLRELQGARNGLKLRFTVESDAALYAFVID